MDGHDGFYEAIASVVNLFQVLTKIVSTDFELDFFQQLILDKPQCDWMFGS